MSSSRAFPGEVGTGSPSGNATKQRAGAFSGRADAGAPPGRDAGRGVGPVPDAPLARRTLLLAALLGPFVLAGCTVAPVYGDPALAEARLDFAYAEPRNRLEQLVYQAVQARLGRSADPMAPLVTISARRGGTGISASGPHAPRVMRVTGTVTVTDPRDGTVLFQATRHAEASYSTFGQALASQQATIEAEERAARELGESLRLTLISGLARGAHAPAGTP